MSDQQIPSPSTSPTSQKAESDNQNAVLSIIGKVSGFVRPFLAQATGGIMAIGGLLSFLGGLYLAFELLTNDFLDFTDVFVATLGIVTATFLFAVLMGIHGVQVFRRARKAAKGNQESTSSTILRAFAGAMRGYGEAFLVAVLVALPFIGLQVLIVDGSLPIPLFDDGLFGAAIMPVAYAVTTLLFSYLSAELLETLAGIRENTG